MLSPYLLLSNKVNTSVTTFRYKDPPIKSLRLLKVYLPSCIKISKLFYYTVLISLFNSLSSFHPSLPEILPCPTPVLCFWVTSNQLYNFFLNNHRGHHDLASPHAIIVTTNDDDKYHLLGSYSELFPSIISYLCKGYFYFHFIDEEKETQVLK